MMSPLATIPVAAGQVAGPAASQPAAEGAQRS